jgi:hypothetical protein
MAAHFFYLRFSLNLVNFASSLAARHSSPTRPVARRLVTSAIRLLADAPLWGLGEAAQPVAPSRPNPTTSAKKCTSSLKIMSCFIFSFTSITKWKRKSLNEKKTNNQ